MHALASERSVHPKITAVSGSGCADEFVRMERQSIG